MNHIVLLDNEAVHALSDPAHPKHRMVISQAQVIADRKRRAISIATVVPTAVRTESGWDRTAPAWAFLNRLRIADLALDSAQANVAATIRRRNGVSVADAHLGAAIQLVEANRITVVTSDPQDIRLVAGEREITIVCI